MMASSAGPLTNTGNGYTIVTQVFSPSSRSSATEQNPTSNPLGKFLKGEPKALGTIQIIIGLLCILIGIVFANTTPNISVFSGVFIWGSLFNIISGSLTVAASNKPNICLIKGVLVMSIFSAISAGIFIIILSLDCAYGRWLYRDTQIVKGVSGVLLVFNILQFAISIAVSAFVCKVSCRSEPMVNVITLLPNSEAGCPELNPLPASYAQQGAFMNMVTGAMGQNAALVNTVPGAMGQNAAFVHTVPGTMGQNAAFVNMVPGAMGQNAAFVNTVPGAMGQNIGLVNTGPGNMVPVENPPPYSESKMPPPV